MPARLCQTCGIHFPAGVKECEACGTDTIWNGKAVPDGDWQLQVELLREASPERRQVRRWRQHQLTEMGFRGVALELLVETPSVPLHDVSDLLAGGCPLELAAKILL